MHILNRRRFFIVLSWIVFQMSFVESTSAYAQEEFMNQDLLVTLQRPEVADDRRFEREEDALVEAIKQEDYPVDTVIATGYTAGVESTGKDPSHAAYGITYAGVPVRRDTYSTIAADPMIYPIGTILYIPGYGYGVVTDIGSAIQGNKIDLYYETVEDVYQQWGKQTVDVYVIEQGDGSVSEEELHQLNRATSEKVFKHEATKTGLENE